jgi:hypothetical protein
MSIKNMKAYSSPNIKQMLGEVLLNLLCDFLYSICVPGIMVYVFAHYGWRVLQWNYAFIIFLSNNVCVSIPFLCLMNQCLSLSSRQAFVVIRWTYPRKMGRAGTMFYFPSSKNMLVDCKIFNFTTLYRLSPIHAWLCDDFKNHMMFLFLRLGCVWLLVIFLLRSRKLLNNSFVCLVQN